MTRPEDQPNGQSPDQIEEIVESSIPVRREEISPAAFTIDRHLASLGFTENLPVLVQDLNYALGGNDFGDVNQTPTRVTYRFDPHRFAPRVVREEVYDYGPKIELTVAPGKGDAVLRIGRIPQVSPDFGMSYWLPLRGFSEWTGSSHITSARLPDLQAFLHDIFPDKKASLYRSGYEREVIDEDLESLTTERLQELPTTNFTGILPYMVKIEGAYTPDQPFDPFLVIGIRHFQGKPTNPKDEKVFDLHAVIYDARKYNGSGEDIEKILDGLRLLWAKDPSIEQWNVEYRQKAREIRERFLGQEDKEKNKFDVDVRHVHKIDLPYLRRILEMWVRWQGEIIPEEVEDDLAHVRESLDRYDKEEYLVANDASGRVVGMMGLAFEPKPEVKQHARTEKPMELVRAYVDNNFRGRGVGKALIGHIESLAKSRGATEILLDSGPRYKETGHGFYDKMGYARIAVNKDFYGPDGDAQIWSKMLR